MAYKAQLTVILILISSHGGKAFSSSMEKDDILFDALEFGHRSAPHNTSRSFDVEGSLRDKRRIPFRGESDPMEHMLSMFHSALQLAQFEDILNQAIEFEDQPEERIVTNPRPPTQQRFQSFARADPKALTYIETPPTPTKRVQFSQNRILTGNGGRPQVRNERLRGVTTIQRSTPPVRTLAPKPIRFLHTTTNPVEVSRTTTPLPIKRLPSFKPQNIPTRQRIRIKIPKVQQPSPSRRPTPVPKRIITSSPRRPFFFSSPTPIVSSLPTTTRPTFERIRSSTTTTPQPFESSNSNFLESNGIKSLRISSLPLKKKRVKSGRKRPSLQFQKFQKAASSIKLPHKSAIKSLPPQGRSEVHLRKSSPAPLTAAEPFVPSPKVVEGNFVPSRQAWSGKEQTRSEPKRRPPVVPRVPLLPKKETSNFIKTNDLNSNFGPGFRKGKNINGNPPILSNQDLLSLFTVSTDFKCSNQEYPGLYADVDTNCQTFHMCQVGGRQNTFICPVGTLFDQRYLVCNWSSRVDCRKSPEYYNINSKIYESSA